MPRLALQTPYTLTKNPTTGNAVWPAALGERDSQAPLLAHRLHGFNPYNPGNPNNNNPFRNLGAARSKDGRRARCSRISAGTSSSPRSATS